MSTEIKTFEIIDDKLIPIKTSLVKEGKKEKDHLEQWIKTNPEILGDDIAVIGEQVQTASGPVDFLGVDSTGNIVIIELKRDQLPREVIVQAIDYASDIANWEPDRFQEICLSYTGKPFEDFFQEKFENVSLDDLAINQAQGTPPGSGSSFPSSPGSLNLPASPAAAAGKALPSGAPARSGVPGTCPVCPAPFLEAFCMSRTRRYPCRAASCCPGTGHTSW